MRVQHLVIMTENGTNSPTAECQQFLEAEGHPHTCTGKPLPGMHRVRNPNTDVWTERTVALRIEVQLL